MHLGRPEGPQVVHRIWLVGSDETALIVAVEQDEPAALVKATLKDFVDKVRSSKLMASWPSSKMMES